MFFKKQTSIDTIIVGLGNPGKKYEGTRHNAGFAALDHVAEKWGVRVTKAKFDALTGTGTAAGVKVLLMKPQTFMNLSATGHPHQTPCYSRISDIMCRNQNSALSCS